MYTKHQMLSLIVKKSTDTEICCMALLQIGLRKQEANTIAN